jgi:hypothetical protein
LTFPVGAGRFSGHAINYPFFGNARKKMGRLRISLIFWFEHLVLREHGCNGFGRDATPHKLGELAAVVDVCDLEADDQPEAEAGDADERVTDNVDHFSSLLSGLPLKFIDNGDHGIGIKALFCQHHETLGIIHDEELVAKDHTDGKGDDPDAYVNQKVGEQISHSTSQSLLRGLPDKFIE